MRFLDDCNDEMSQYIGNCVKGVHPDISADVLNAAMKRYFTSKKEAACRQAKNKTEYHKRKQATYERKKEKVKRRLSALKSKNWPPEKKQKVQGFLQDKSVIRYTSSDEEGDDGFVTHPFSWESDEIRIVKASLDKKYLEICPLRSRRLLAKRDRGSNKEETVPFVPESLAWIVKTDG